ncbi:hypothetical protein [Hymenobacter volaticus]|uniref:Response regulator n=1 Tax=Hymenobacter volaticus TaxID=2932254 RepID=A0ABY4GI85_9BACT|nr:hypothetical protein [Hymenobacter volaticus]UOQ69879.1 hypothetical protein MUN86_30725 [Hymenobacter volaticus]
MSLVIEGYELNVLSVIDDNPANRDTVRGEIEDLGIDAYPLTGPFFSENEAFEAIYAHSQAVICDHHLSHHDYARFSGAKLVATCYDRHFPAVLVTRWTTDIIEDIRPIRHKIPALLTPRELTENVDHLEKVLRECMQEVFLGKFSKRRKPWQTLVRIDDIDISTKTVLLVIPAWDGNKGGNGIKIPMQSFDKSILHMVNPGVRFFAHVNLGAEKIEDVYIKDFQFRG